MGTKQILPTPAEIAGKIESCRKELAALRRLYRLCKAAHEAEAANRARKGVVNA
jgi:hypothetical protein